MMGWGGTGFCWKKRSDFGSGKEFLRVFWKKKTVRDLGNENFMRKILEGGDIVNGRVMG